MSTSASPTPPAAHAASAPVQPASPRPLMRSCWVALALLAVGLLAAGMRERSLQLHDPCAAIDCGSELALTLGRAGISPGAYAAYQFAIASIYAFACLTLAVVLALRAPGSPLALLTAVVVTAPGASLGMLHGLGERGGLGGPVVRFLDSPGLFFLWLYLFPDGRFVPRWTRCPASLALGIGLAGAILPGSHVDPDTWPVALPLQLCLVLSVVFAQIYRYRRVSSPAQRQQTKWAVTGLAAFLAFAAVVSVTWIVPSPMPMPDTRTAALVLVALGGAFSLIPLVIPVSCTIAILRYRLWDIDVIIQRTLVYGALTAALVAIYWLGVATLQWAIARLVGRQGSQLAIIATTLAIAALARPLRRAIQRAIDRRFYRRTYDAQRVLADFVAALRDETDPERLCADLLAVVEEALQPARVSLWLRADRGVARTSATASREEARQVGAST